MYIFVLTRNAKQVLSISELEAEKAARKKKDLRDKLRLSKPSKVPWKATQAKSAKKTLKATKAEEKKAKACCLFRQKVEEQVNRGQEISQAIETQIIEYHGIRAVSPVLLTPKEHQRRENTEESYDNPTAGPSVVKEEGGLGLVGLNELSPMGPEHPDTRNKSILFSMHYRDQQVFWDSDDDDDEAYE